MLFREKVAIYRADQVEHIAFYVHTGHID